MVAGSFLLPLLKKQSIKMYLVTLTEAKKHLNIDNFTEDDIYISSLIEVAYISIKNYCNQVNWVDSSGITSGTTEFADDTIYGSTIPLPIAHAILLLVGNFYANREPVSFASAQPIPYTFQYLIDPYKNYGDLTTTTTTTVAP